MGPLRRFFACCVTGTADRKDTEDPYETDSQQPPTANLSPVAQATVAKGAYDPVPRHTAAPEGQQLLPTPPPGVRDPPQQLGNLQGPQQHGMRDVAPSSGPQRDQQGSTGVTGGSSTPQAVHADPAQLEGGSPLLQKDSLQQGTAQPSDTAPASAAPALSPAGIGPDTPASGIPPTAALTAVQGMQLAPQHFAPNATAGYMQQQQQHAWPQYTATGLYQHKMGLMHPHVLDPIAESPRPPPGAASPSRPHPAAVSVLGSPANQHVLPAMVQAAAPTAAGLQAEASALGATPAATSAPGQPLLPPLLLQRQQEQQQQPGHAHRPAAAAVDAAQPAAPAAPTALAGDEARRLSLESPTQYRAISLAQGLADSDVFLTPTAAASQPDTPTMGLVEASNSELQPLQPPPAAAAAGESAASGDAGPSRPYGAALTTAPGMHGSSTVGGEKDGAVAGQQAVLPATPAAAAAASPKRFLVTPFTMASAQQLVTNELQAQRSSSNRNGGVTSSNNFTAGTSSSGMVQGSTTTTQHHSKNLPSNQQQQVQHKPLRERLSEDVEEAVVAQIRDRRATSIASGADPSRVWALVAQFDSSKQQAAAAGAGAAAAMAAAPAGSNNRRFSTAYGGVQQLFPAAPAAGDDLTPAHMAQGQDGILPQQQQLPQLAVPARSPGSNSAARGSFDETGARSAAATAAAAYSSISPPTSPHSTSWSVDSNTSDVPLGLRKIKLGKTKAPKAEAAEAAIAAAAAASASEHTGGSNIYSGSSSGHVLSGSSAGVGSAAGRDRQYPDRHMNMGADMDMNVGSAGDVGGAGGFVPHFRPAPIATGRSPSTQGMTAASAGRVYGLPPRPRSSNSLERLAGTSSSSNSAGWATGLSSSSANNNNSSSKHHSGTGLAGQGGQYGSAGVGQGAGEMFSGTGLYSPPDRVAGESQSFTSGLTGVGADRVGSLQGAGDSWGPFMHYQQQIQLKQNLARQGQGVGSGWSSESEGEGEAGRGDGEGRGPNEWEVLPVMPLSPLRVPRNQVQLNGGAGVLDDDETPPTPKTSVVGVSNSIIDYMLSEEGIPLVPTSGVNETAGVHGLDSPFFSGPIFHSSSMGRQQQLAQVSSWGGGDCTTPRFSHSGSFSAYGPGSRLSPSPGRVFGPSHSFAGHGAERLRQGLNQGPGRDRFGRRLPSAGGRGTGARRLSVGEVELRRGRQGMQGQQQQRVVRSLELRVPSSAVRGSVDRPRGASDPSEHSSSTGNVVVGSGYEPPETPKRASYIGSGSLFGHSRPSQEEASKFFGDLQGPVAQGTPETPKRASYIGSGSLFGDSRPSQEEGSRFFGDLQGPAALATSSHSQSHKAEEVFQALPVAQGTPETPKRASYIGSGSLFGDSRPSQEEGSRFFGDLQGPASSQSGPEQRGSADRTAFQALPVVQGSSSHAGNSGVGQAAAPAPNQQLYGQQGLATHGNPQAHQVSPPTAADLSFAVDGDSVFAIVGEQQPHSQAVMPVMMASGSAGRDSPAARSAADSPVSRLAAQARATAAAVAAVAKSAASPSGSAAENSNRLEAVPRGPANAGSSSSSSFFLSGQNDSAGYATSASNLPSDAAVFSRSGWAAMNHQEQQPISQASNLPSDAALFSRSGLAAMHHQQQQPGSQEQQLQGQWSAGGRGGRRDYGPVALFETPKEPKPRGEASALLPRLATALEHRTG